jgi:hypothetical protein
MPYRVEKNRHFLYSVTMTEMKKIGPIGFYINILIVLILVTQTVTMAEPEVKVPGLFDSEEILDITLAFDINKLRKDKGDKRSYHPAVLSYTGPANKEVTLNVRVMSRGKLRRIYLNCEIPPLKLKFHKKETRGTLFRKQKTLKMVTHCKPKGGFPVYYLHEYLAYKAYTLLSPLSFHVRLVRMTYKDTTAKIAPITNIAFFLENTKKMAKRNGGKKCKSRRILLRQTDFKTSLMVSVFQYMIGNTDWSIQRLHNIEVIVVGDKKKKYYPVPYDFDFSGLVNANYAKPAANLPTKSVRERIFLGNCDKPEQLEPIFKRFHLIKDEMYNMYDKFPLLPKDIKKKGFKYLDEFYRIISTPKLVKKYFINNYRGLPSRK